MKKYIYITFFCLLFSLPICAQVNIEKYNSIINEKGFFGNLSMYLSAKTGNTDIQEFGIDGRVNFTGDSYYTFLIGQGEYGWNKGQEYSNNALLHLRYIRNINYLIKPEVFAQINYNKKLIVLFRSLIGGGVRVTIAADSLSDFIFGSSYMYEHEKIDLPDQAGHPNLTNDHRWSNYLSFSNMLSRNSRLSIVIYAQPKFDDFNDVRILSENHLSVGITEKLSLSLQFGLRYDSKPPNDVNDFDTNTKIGFFLKI